jgi:putative oxidoreductase
MQRPTRGDRLTNAKEIEGGWARAGNAPAPAANQGGLSDGRRVPGRTDLFAATFVLSGVQVHLIGRAGAIEDARSSGAPAAELMVPLSGVAIVAGGVSVALGIWADLGALILAAFALSVMCFMHAFWKEQDEQVMQNQFAHFMKNVAMAGGALVIFWAYNQAQGGPPCRSRTRSSAEASAQ